LKASAVLKEERAMKNARGIYDKSGELFAYLVGSAVYDLEDNQVGRLRESVIYSMDGEERWTVRGDGLYTQKGETIGYLGAHFAEDQ
jgi:hypothetical protein